MATTLDHHTSWSLPMWTDITHYLPKFKSTVLTGLDAAGNPYSLRCRPSPDSISQTLRLSLPDDIPLKNGPACMLFHKHDARLWNLLSFVVRGVLERDGQNWIFRPESFVPGVGIGGIPSYFRFLVNGRKATNQYLQNRGLVRPQIPWEEWREVFDQTESSV